MKNQEGEIKIYVACLAAYNNGQLHGGWINACQDADQIRWAIHDILKSSPIECAEEYAIHDYEGFEAISLREYEDIDHVAALAAFIDEHGKLGAKLYEYYSDVKEAEDALSDRYNGEYCVFRCIRPLKPEYPATLCSPL